MISKIFEIRDHATYIPVLATELVSDNEVESYHLKRTGWHNEGFIVISKLSNLEIHVFPSDWESQTMQYAHGFIAEHFSRLESGAVIDVRVIRGETNTTAISERFVDPHTGGFDLET